jgi:uncharacterized protein YndB with AHSA1/START domain
MSTSTNRMVRVKRGFKASDEPVFDAWLDPEKAGKWLFATPQGQMVRVDIDARVDGKFCIVDRRAGEDVAHVGEYLEIDRPRRLAFTFSVPKYSEVITKVTLTIVPLDEGCELTLTHENVLPEYKSGTETGWMSILDALDAQLKFTS